MDRLWAPWRMVYIEKPSQDECIFCSKTALEDQEAMIVHRGKSSFIMLNAFPYNNGHLLISAYKHTASLSDLTLEEKGDLLEEVDLAISLLNEVCSPDGHNVGINMGRVSGAGIVDHLHVHVVPRWNGDTNFMPVIADVKVLPEALESVWQKLHTAAQGRSTEK